MAEICTEADSTFIAALMSQLSRYYGSDVHVHLKSDLVKYGEKLAVSGMIYTRRSFRYALVSSSRHYYGMLCFRMLITNPGTNSNKALGTTIEHQ